MISAGAIGCAGYFAPLAGVAPKTVRQLYDVCATERYGDGRKAQETIAALRQAVKKEGVAGLKAAMRGMGRDCGGPRPPLKATGEIEQGILAAALEKIPALRAEPRGWA
jgi:dihydrodipicolinate synthase/N-acetylneuraminate lyase